MCVLQYIRFMPECSACEERKFCDKLERNQRISDIQATEASISNAGTSMAEMYLGPVPSVSWLS